MALAHGADRVASPAATSLLLVGTLAAFLAVQSGGAAHGPVERIPGVADAVTRHEHWGERAQNAFFVVAVAELVYSYAGGPGLRNGNPEDVGRLLVAGVYNQAQADRKAGRPGDAAALVSAIAPRFASDPNVQVMAAESALIDRKDPAAENGRIKQRLAGSPAPAR